MAISSKLSKYFTYAGAFGVCVPMALAACGDDTTDGTGGDTTSTGGTTSSGGSGGSTGGSPSTGGSGGSGGTGGSTPTCDATAPGATRGSAIAISPDDKTLVIANRDVGSVSVMRVDYAAAIPAVTKVAEVSVGTGSEPWQVAVNACGTTAYAVLRNHQKIVEIRDIDTSTPTLGREVNVGSEPTGVALSPNNTKVYVTNWVEGTVSVVDTATMTAEPAIDLNTPLAGSGLLGLVTSRPSLAHPRGIAITNDGDKDDDDETLFVTEWYGQRTSPEDATGSNADVNKKGIVYKVTGNTATIVDLPPVLVTGFKDHNNGDTGCYPNQVANVTVEGTKAYVTSTCASPKGPLGVFQPTTACAIDSQCGAIGGTCNLTTLTCNPNVTDVKTTTHPALSIIDVTGVAPTTTTVLDGLFDAPAVDSARMPHLPTDIGFFNGFAYITAMGADAVFRLEFLPNGTIVAGSQANDFINLRKDAADTTIRLPLGIATAHDTRAFAFVSNDGSRDVTALDFQAQAIAGASSNAHVIAQSALLPGGGTPEETQLRGKRFFNTGLGRWSLNGEAWGSCAACHIDGLSDNVTWYFARGPRQSTSLDGSYGPNGDRRLFNWTAIFDETADFEGNIRGVSGGVGAIVSATSAPPVNADRINTATLVPPQQGLQGSSGDVANKESLSAVHSVLDDWEEVEAYLKTIRSPRKPATLVQADVDAGRLLFTDPLGGNCIGCHSGPKWTISRVFYPVGNVANAATASADPASLSNKTWNVNLNGFPQALFPVDPATSLGSAFMRFGAPPGAEQIQCILRPVGTFGVSPEGVGVKELRQDMSTVAQGAAATGRGYNPPSLLGMQVGAPYFHAGNARSLEEVFDDTLFAGHHRTAIANVFVPTADTKRQLVAFLLSIDEATTTVAIPAKGDKGGDICFYP